MNSGLWTDLLQTLTAMMSLSELQTLSFDSNIDYEDIPHDTKSELALELIRKHQNNGTLHKLISAGRSLRPDLSWQEYEHALITNTADDLSLERQANSLVLDALDFKSYHAGYCISGLMADERNQESAPSIGLTATNDHTNDILLVNRIEIRKEWLLPSISCTFPNDPITGALIDYYRVLVDLEDKSSTDNLLPAILQLKPRETFAMKIGFRGKLDHGYRLRLLLHWKTAGHDSGQKTVSDPYLVHFSNIATTWEEQLDSAIQDGQDIAVRLASGVESLSEYFNGRSFDDSSISIKKIHYRSTLEEFIVIGDSTIIIPVIPPRNRYIEQSRYNRKGILVKSKEMARKYIGNFIDER
jgi:hypothetical protein